MPGTDKTFAVITGAAGGLGKMYARELAGRGYHLLPVDKPGSGLKPHCKKWEEAFGIKCHPIEADLTDEKQIRDLITKINAYPVEVLINNVGTGGTMAFVDTPAEKILNILRLNTLPVTLLTHGLLPNLMQRKQAYVLNVGSLSAFTPNGYKSVYPASKSFVHFISRGLYYELCDTPVHISVVHPGPMPTNPEIRSRIRKQGILARWSLSDPEKTAKVSLDKMFRKTPLIFIDRSNRIIWLLTRLLPEGLLARSMSAVVKRELEK